MKKILVVLAVAISCIVFSSCKDKECTCKYLDESDGDSNTFSQVFTMDELKNLYGKSDAKKCSEFNESYMDNGIYYRFECK